MIPEVSHRRAQNRGGPTRQPCLANQQRGAVLIVGLIVLAVMTLVGVSAMRGTALEERMAGNLRQQAAAFQAAEAGLQGGLTAIESSPRPPAPSAWGTGSLLEACRVTDPNTAAGCTNLTTTLADWRDGEAAPSEGVALAALGGAALAGLSAGDQPRILIEERYVAPLDFEAAVQRRGIHFYTVAALGQGAGGESAAILQTTIAKVYAW